MHIVIIGSGMAGITFAEELHKLDPSARLTVLTHETHGYYSRPMLSHGFSRDDVETKIILRSFEDLCFSLSLSLLLAFSFLSFSLPLVESDTDTFKSLDEAFLSAMAT